MKMNEKIPTKEQILSSKHLKDYRKNDRNMTQEQFADEMNCATVTLGRYERGEYKIPDDIIEKLSFMSGWIKEYWQGLTDCKTTEEYEKELLLYVEELEQKGLEGYEIHRQYKERRRGQIKTLLNACGFGYEDFSDGSPEHDWLMLIKDQAPLMVKEGYPHKITCRKNGGLETETFLNDSELSALLTDISDLIAFRCFQKSQRKISASRKNE
ncbi:MAG: helix-turn-helix transcriptional regulator [Lachnospiraceae bacterium]|nr:helix-turn-helix transcriptional regulator [Lachnospiraceae bacterium]